MTSRHEGFPDDLGYVKLHDFFAVDQDGEELILLVLPQVEYDAIVENSSNRPLDLMRWDDKDRSQNLVVQETNDINFIEFVATYTVNLDEYSDFSPEQISALTTQLKDYFEYSKPLLAYNVTIVPDKINVDIGDNNSIFISVSLKNTSLHVELFMRSLRKDTPSSYDEYKDFSMAWGLLNAVIHDNADVMNDGVRNAGTYLTAGDSAALRPYTN